jgi:hypothetical protein
MRLRRPICTLLVSLALVVSQPGAARPSRDLVKLGHDLVDEIYAKPAKVAHPTYLVEVQEFSGGEVPTRARVVLREKDPCCSEPGVDVLEVYLVTNGGRLTGFSAKGKLIETARQGTDAERIARRAAAIKSVLRFTGWRRVERSMEDPLDAEREIVLFKTGDSLGEQRGYFDRRSGLPITIGIAF